MSDQACCAHRRISYRTEPCDGLNVRGEVIPGGAVRGWWECDSGCGTKFWPVPAPPGGAAEAPEWAKRFHDAYERLAPVYGYKTRWDVSPIAWEALPESNRNLVTAVCAELIPQILAGRAAPPETAPDEVKRLRDALEFAAAAIEDAIYCEDGLDGGTGQAVLATMREAYPGLPMLALPRAVRPLRDVLKPPSPETAALVGELRDFIQHIRQRLDVPMDRPHTEVMLAFDAALDALAASHNEWWVLGFDNDTRFEVQQRDTERIAWRGTDRQTAVVLMKALNGTGPALTASRGEADPKVAEFIRNIVQCAWDGGDVDGSDIQDWADEAGILVPATMSAPCDPESCACLEMGADFPTTCYRLAERFLAGGGA